MRKVLLALSIALCGVLGASAQSTIFNNPDNRGHLSFRFGGELLCPGSMSYDGIGIKMYNVGGGFNFGFHYSVPVAANFYIEPGINLYFNSFSLKKSWRPSGVHKHFIVRSGIRIPLLAGYHFDFSNNISFHIFTGPEFELGVLGKEYINTGIFFVDTPSGDDIYGLKDTGFRRVDFPWIIGGAITVRNMYFGLSGGIGMRNLWIDKPFIVNDPTITYHENRVSFTIGYYR